MRIVYTDKSIADLTRLRDFITQWNPRSAGRIAKKLVVRIKHLKRFPEMGKPVAEAPDPNVIRDFFFGRYIVRYAVHADVVAILRIWHHLEAREPTD